MVNMDSVIMLCQLSFCFTLPPALRAESKPPLMTCILTFLGLGTLTACYLKMDFYFAGATTLVVTYHWAKLGLQSYKQHCERTGHTYWPIFDWI